MVGDELNCLWRHCGSCAGEHSDAQSFTLLEHGQLATSMDFHGTKSGCAVSASSVLWPPVSQWETDRKDQQRVFIESPICAGSFAAKVSI